MQGRNAGHGREGQRHPGAVDPVAEFDAIVAVTQGNREVPLGAVAVDRNFLEGVRMGTAVLHAGHIGQAQAEAAGTFLLGPLAVCIGDFPEHIRPLGVPG